MGAIPGSEFIWVEIFNYITYRAFEKTASEHRCNTLLKSQGEGDKDWVPLLSKKHSHPQGKVHTEMQWTLSRRFSDCSNWALLQPLQGCSSTCCAMLLTGLWHCQDRLMCHLPEVGTAGMKQDKPEGWGQVLCVEVTLGSEEAPRKLLQQPQF